MARIGGETLVLIADLRERLETFAAIRSVASPRGDFTTRAFVNANCRLCGLIALPA